DVTKLFKVNQCSYLLPVQLHIVEFDKIQESAPGLINNFVDYFEDTFIGRVIHEELPRTNDSSEGWNRAIKNS
ncbi:unnamed protein product, partial [Rotaria sp. Silwood1]